MTDRWRLLEKERGRKWVGVCMRGGGDREGGVLVRWGGREGGVRDGEG